MIFYNVGLFERRHSARFRLLSRISSRSGKIRCQAVNHDYTDDDCWILAALRGLWLGVFVYQPGRRKVFATEVPNPEKLEIYECGEPTIGSSFVQFDIRFYVVALLFIIFDVEVAFFFPWANVFGKSTHLMDPNLPVVKSAATESNGKVADLTPAVAGVYRELSVPADAIPALTAEESQDLAKSLGHSPSPAEATQHAVRTSANQLAWWRSWIFWHFSRS